MTVETVFSKLVRDPISGNKAYFIKRIKLQKSAKTGVYTYLTDKKKQPVLVIRITQDKWEEMKYMNFWDDDLILFQKYI